jgi:hypothetical protein
MKPSDAEPPLTPALNEWQVSPIRHPHFRTAVWARIQAARATLAWPDYLRARAAWVSGAFALALLMGAWMGGHRAKTQEKAERAAMAARYVQALDARTMRMP